MPSLPPVSKVVRLDMFHTVGSNTHIQDRLFFNFTGTGPQLADLNTWLGTVSSAWNTNMCPKLVAQYSLTQLQATDLTSNVGAQAQNTTTRVGTDAVAITPANACLMIKFKITRRYRGGHPRIYLSGIGQTHLANAEQWDSTFSGGVATAFGAFIAAAVLTPPTNLGTMTHVSVNYFQGFTNKQFPSGRMHAVPVVKATPTFDTVIAYSARQDVASQRRRTSI